MFSTSVVIELDKKDDIIDYECFSDIHIGNENHLPDLLEKRMNAVLDEPNRYTGFGGDQFDAILPWDKRFQKESVSEVSLTGQVKEWDEVLEPLFKEHSKRIEKKKNPLIWYLEAGNHEYKIKEIDEQYMNYIICKPRKLTYLGSRGIVGLQINYKGKPLRRWKLLVAHGAGGGMNVKKPLDDMKINHYCDVFLMGHLHQKITFEEYIIDYSFAKDIWIEKQIVLGNTGSFCRTLKDGVDQWYEHRNKLIPSSPGTITISFNAYLGTMNHHI